MTLPCLFTSLTILALIALGLVYGATADRPKPDIVCQSQSSAPHEPPMPAHTGEFKVTLTRFDVVQATWDRALKVDGKRDEDSIRWDGLNTLMTGQTLYVTARTRSWAIRMGIQTAARRAARAPPAVSSLKRMLEKARRRGEDPWRLAPCGAAWPGDERALFATLTRSKPRPERMCGRVGFRGRAWGGCGSVIINLLDHIEVDFAIENERRKATTIN